MAGAVHVWGGAAVGQLGCPKEDLPQDEDGYPYQPVAQALGLSKICQTAAGDGHSCAVTTAGKLYTWGANRCGQLGRADSDGHQGIPRLVSALEDVCILQVACGDAHTLALSRDGLVYSWGAAGCGQLGMEVKFGYEAMPRVVEHLRPQRVSQISCGRAHSLAVTKGSRLYTWGAADAGQLGHEMESFQVDADGCAFQPVPREVEFLKSLKIKQACGGASHSLALTEEGYVYACGSDDLGQLGVKEVLEGSKQPRISHPQPVFGLETVVLVASGANHSMALDQDGRVYTWGSNRSGQLGLESVWMRAVNGHVFLPRPAMVTALTEPIMDLAAGEDHSLAVSRQGNLYSWGSCSCGRLGGHDGQTFWLTPSLVSCFQHAVRSVACGSTHNLAITESDESLAASLATLVNNEMLADMAFQCSEGSVVFAHSCILQHSAPSLHAYATSHRGKRSVKSQKKQLPLVAMPNARKEVLEDLLHYIYTQEVEVAKSLVSFPAVLELYHLAMRFEISALLRRCRRLIRNKLGRQSVNQSGTLLDVRGSSLAAQSAVFFRQDEATSLPGGDSWGIFFMPNGQAMVSALGQGTLGQGTPLNLQDIETPLDEQLAPDKHMRKMMSNASCDVTLVPGHEPAFKMEAHKCILASRSLHFQDIFTRPRSCCGGPPQRKIVLHGLTLAQLKVLLDFIYADEWQPNDLSFALEMLPIAARLGIEELSRLCQQTLVGALSVETTSQILALADACGCLRLRRRCLLFMAQHREKVLKTLSFSQLEKALIVEVLQTREVVVPVPPQMELGFSPRSLRSPKPLPSRVEPSEPIQSLQSRDLAATCSCPVF